MARDSLKSLEQPHLIPETKDVIGFDLGHGDTSLIRVPASGGRVQILEAVIGLKVIATAVGTRADGSIVIGKDAFRRDIADVVQQFKSPYVTDPAVAGPLRSFVTQVLKGLRLNNSTIPFDATTLVVFGCPSAWADEQRLAYGRLLAEQVADMQVMLVPESRAAFITMKEEGQLGRTEIREPILIVDLGSSTTDFTFVSDLDPAELPLGKDYPLGAARIERQLVDSALSASPKRKAIEAWWRRCPSEYHRTVWEFRKDKEEFFRDEAAWRTGPPMEVSVTYWPSGTEKLKLEVDLTAAEFDKAIDTPLDTLGERPISWRARFGADLKAASQLIHKLNGGPPKIVILTGGAARMGFVEAITKTLFPEPTSVRRAPEPEHAIAVGLAQAGSIRYRTQAFLDEIEGIINSSQVADIIRTHMDSFAKAIADVVATGATERFIIPEFQVWRSSDQGKLSDVAERISTRMEKWQRSPDGRQKTLTALSPWYRRIEQDLHNTTAPVCLKYQLNADVLDIPKEPFDSSRPSALSNPDEVLFSSARVVMSAVLATISFVTGTILFGTGVAVLAPTGHLAPILAGLFMWLLGEAAKEWVLERVMNMTLPKGVRRLYPASWLEKSLRKRSADTEAEIRTEIVRSLLGGYPDEDPEKPIKEQRACESRAVIVQKMTAGIEAALKQRADEASVLITC